MGRRYDSSQLQFIVTTHRISGRRRGTRDWAGAKSERVVCMRLQMNKTAIRGDIRQKEQVHILRKLFDRLAVAEGDVFVPPVAVPAGRITTKETCLPVRFGHNKLLPFVAPLLIYEYPLKARFSVVGGGGR